MAGSDSKDSPLVASSGVASDTTEAFSLLGDETRLAILLALYEEHEPYAADNAVPFSRILDRVNCDDPGNLSYHLEKLDGQFVSQRTDRGGYELQLPGLSLVRTIIAGAGIDDITRGPADIDQMCPFCEANTTVQYRDGLIVWACTECAGAAPESTETGGPLSLVPFEPAGVADRTAEELRSASVAALMRKARSLFDGLCPTCSGPVEGGLKLCSNHQASGVCEQCGHQYANRARFECRICSDYGTTLPKRLALFHPTVVSFYDDHDVSIRVRADDYEAAKRVHDLMDDHAESVVSEDPPRVAVTVEYAGDEIRLTFDETVHVVEVDR